GRSRSKPIGVLWDGKGDLAGEYEVGHDGVTYVVPAGKWVPEWISRGSGMVGLRVSQHKGVMELIQGVGPIAAASANISGEKECLTRDEVEKVFGQEFPVMDGSCGSGRASRVVIWHKGGWKEMRKG
ncbi:MAG: Sua5/YciO/YrdC/YwlC family protein, partial [Simkaniaceae bacterium]|nr:Sua5/YciO/YrdC/YwlC family protein [Simkaniaceae bacterium]